MSGKAIIIVGQRGSGKSTFLRSQIKKVHPEALFIFDVNGEYKDLYPKPLLSFDEFTDLCTRVSNGVIAVEEATIFLNNRGNDRDVREFLVKARHKNTTILFCYHSLTSVPGYIFDLADYLVIHKTKDQEEDVISKFRSKEITAAFQRVKRAKWIDTGKSRNGKSVLYSPHEVVAT